MGDEWFLMFVLADPLAGKFVELFLEELREILGRVKPTAIESSVILMSGRWRMMRQASFRRMLLMKPVMLCPVRARILLYKVLTLLLISAAKASRS